MRVEDITTLIFCVIMVTTNHYFSNISVIRLARFANACPVIEYLSKEIGAPASPLSQILCTRGICARSSTPLSLAS